MSETPRISVVTANYNHGHIIHTAIESVATQDFPAIEHVIVDDGSTDDSVEIIRTLQKKYPRIRLVKKESNSGVCETFGRGIREAAGDYVINLSADDALTPGTLLKMANILRQHPATAMICGDYDTYNIQTKIEITRHRLNHSAATYISPKDLVRNQQHGIYPVGGAGTLVRKKDILEARFDDPGYRWHHDWIAFNAVAYRHGFWYVPQSTVRYTVDGRNYSFHANKWENQRKVLNHIFEIMMSCEMEDVRNQFRDSSFFSQLPFIVRFLLTNSSYKSFLTASMLRNRMVISGYHHVRRFVPQSLFDTYLSLRSPK